MFSKRMFSYPLVFSLVFILILVMGCNTAQQSNKIPITTSSDEARENFLMGRDFAEKLRGQESLQYFEKAMEKDPNFALAHFNYALSQPTAKGFFKQMNIAVKLSENVSKGEQLLILGFQAGVNGFPIKQREIYQELLTLYPEDERAHMALGTNYFGQQEFAQAIEQYKKATEINPDFSPAFNQLGYSYRQLGNYIEAENAFKRYIELIPDDPNPYDSYAELLMKMGRYEESIVQYQKALSVNSNFVASHIGLATNYNYLGQHDKARDQLEKLYQIARNDGEKRAALFAKAVSYLDEGKMEDAMTEIKKQYELAEQIDDAAAMSGDLINMANILYEQGKYEEAKEIYEKSVAIVEQSDLSEEVKENTKLTFLYNDALIAGKKNEFEEANTKVETYLENVKERNNPVQIMLGHQAAGVIALQEENYDQAIAELQQASQQNPYNYYRLAMAYKAKGDIAKAKEYCEKAANFNALNSMNYAFIRAKAKKMLATMQ